MESVGMLISGLPVQSALFIYVQILVQVHYPQLVAKWFKNSQDNYKKNIPNLDSAEIF